MPLVKPAPLRLLFQGSCGKYDIAIMIHSCNLSLPLVSVSADAVTNKMMAAVFCYGGVVLESGGDWWPINNAKRRHKSASDPGCFWLRMRFLWATNGTKIASDSRVDDYHKRIAIGQHRCATRCSLGIDYR